MSQHVLLIDNYDSFTYNLVQALAIIGAQVTVKRHDKITVEEANALQPSHLMVSPGPGRPEDAGVSVAVVSDMMKRVPVLGVCLGHQILALAAGAKTKKMTHGHHGANHPVKDIATGKVEIVSMNHGFTVDGDTLPENVEETHVSLFDGTNSGIALKDAPAFSVQHHPEASPGPQDSFYIFRRFVEGLKAA